MTEILARETLSLPLFPEMAEEQLDIVCEAVRRICVADQGVKSMTEPDGDIVNQRTTAVSIVVPCYNEASNIPVLYERLRQVLDSAGFTWEIIAVDDHSRDKTFELLTSLAQRDQRVSIIRLSRNVGSHIALMCGLA